HNRDFRSFDNVIIREDNATTIDEESRPETELVRILRHRPAKFLGDARVIEELRIGHAKLIFRARLNADDRGNNALDDIAIRRQLARHRYWLRGLSVRPGSYEPCAGSEA